MGFSSQGKYYVDLKNGNGSYFIFTITNGPNLYVKVMKTVMDNGDSIMINLKNKRGAKNTDFVNYSVKITQNWTVVKIGDFGQAVFVYTCLGLFSSQKWKCNR